MSSNEKLVVAGKTSSAEKRKKRQRLHQEISPVTVTGEAEQTIVRSLKTKAKRLTGYTKENFKLKKEQSDPKPLIIEGDFEDEAEENWNNNEFTSDPKIGISVFSNPSLITPSDASLDVPMDDDSSISDYIIGGLLGKGAIGKVFKGLNKKNGTFVAIKQFPKHLKSSFTSMREMEILKELDHPNILKMIDFVEKKDFVYIVLEYIENGSLKDILEKFGTFPESLAKIYVTQILRGLKYLHDRGIIHRDIKGANILITKEGECKLADFGFAAHISSDSSNGPAGSPYWMAPELFDSDPTSKESDIWSLGCTVIELITGHPPYWGLGALAAVFQIVENPSPPIPTHISASLSSFLLSCFAQPPSSRASVESLLKHPWLATSNPNIPSLSQPSMVKKIPSTDSPTNLNRNKIELTSISDRAHIHRISTTPLSSSCSLLTSSTATSTSSTQPSTSTSTNNNNNNNVGGGNNNGGDSSKSSSEKSGNLKRRTTSPNEPVIETILLQRNSSQQQQQQLQHHPHTASGSASNPTLPTKNIAPPSKKTQKDGISELKSAIRQHRKTGNKDQLKKESLLISGILEEQAVDMPIITPRSPFRQRSRSPLVTEVNPYVQLLHRDYTKLKSSQLALPPLDFSFLQSTHYSGNHSGGSGGSGSYGRGGEDVVMSPNLMSPCELSTATDFSDTDDLTLLSPLSSNNHHHSNLNNQIADDDGGDEFNDDDNNNVNTTSNNNGGGVNTSVGGENNEQRNEIVRRHTSNVCVSETSSNNNNMRRSVTQGSSSPSYHPPTTTSNSSNNSNSDNNVHPNVHFTQNETAVINNQKDNNNNDIKSNNNNIMNDENKNNNVGGNGDEDGDSKRRSDTRNERSYSADAAERFRERRFTDVDLLPPNIRSLRSPSPPSMSPSDFIQKGRRKMSFSNGNILNIGEYLDRLKFELSLFPKTSKNIANYEFKEMFDSLFSFSVNLLSFTEVLYRQLTFAKTDTIDVSKNYQKEVAKNNKLNKKIQNLVEKIETFELNVCKNVSQPDTRLSKIIFEAPITFHTFPEAKKGVMKIKRNGEKAWHKRYVVCKDDFLFLFKSYEGDDEPNETIWLNKVNITPIPNTPSGPNHSFILSTRKKSYHLSFATQDIMFGWMKCFTYFKKWYEDDDTIIPEDFDDVK